MFCKHCGALVFENTGICGICGAAVETEEIPASQAPASQIPASQIPVSQIPASQVSDKQETMVFTPIPEFPKVEMPIEQTQHFQAPVQPQPVYTPQPVSAPTAQTGESNKGRTALIVCICVVIVAILGVLAVLLLPMITGETEEISGSSKRIHNNNSSSVVSTEAAERNYTIVESNPYYIDYVSADTYVLSASDTKYYSRSELSGMTRQQLYLAERELFARYGGTFTDGDLAEFFNAKTWYTPDSPAANFNESRFTDIERVNLLLLRALLMERDGTASTNPYTKLNNNVEGFVLPYSDSSRINKNDVQNLSEQELAIAYSEIYARKGYIFDDNDLQLYFSGKNWYTPTTLPGSFNTAVDLSDIERDNYTCLQECQKKLQGVRFSSGNKYRDYYNTYSEYIFPSSSTYKIDPYEAKYLNEEQLMIARNEIYARYGYTYNLAELREYFMNCSWYYPTVPNGKLELIDLSDTEEYNVKMLQAFELNLKLRKGEGSVNTKMSYYAKHDFMTMYLPEHWRLHCVCVKPTGLSGNLEFYEKYNHDDGYGGWVFSMELVPTSQSIPYYSGQNVDVYGYVTAPDGTEYYVLKVTPTYREDDFLEKIYELMYSEVDTIFNSIEWKSGYTFTRA